MEPHSDSHLIHIRSKDCVELTSGFNTHLKVELAEALQLKVGHQFHISISSAEIPYVFYAISSYLKSNQIEVDGLSSLVITDGNYDIYDLVAVINADLIFPFSATFNDNTYKVELTNTSGSVKTLNFDSVNSRELAKMLGFNRAPNDVLPGNSVQSDGVVNLRPIHSMFLHSNLAATNVIVTREGPSLASIENILDKIPLGEVGPSQIITYDPYETAPFSTVLDVDAIQEFEISLRDQNARLIQLNDARYEITLLIQEVLTYDKDDQHPTHPYPEFTSSDRRRMLDQEETPKKTQQPTMLIDNNQSSAPSSVMPSTQRMSFQSPLPQPARTVQTVKRPRIDDEHLKKQEIDLQNALLYAAAIDN
tara:strand:+ start:5693 stop:6784 length:1092 start_codon:yes stop_codon:yes gene_type:complete